MKKRITVWAACLLCAAGIAVGASAAGVIQKIEAELRPDFTIKVDGKTQNFKNANGDVVYPLLYDGTTYLPVRAIGELMGKTVYWYEGDKLIELKDADVIISGKKNDDKKDDNQKPSYKHDSHHDNIGTLPADVKGISLDEAKNIALKKAGLSANEVIFKEASYDFDDGKWVCEIEFVKDKVEYSADILASDGTILSWDVDHD